MEEPPDGDSQYTAVVSTLNQFTKNKLIKQKLNEHVLNSNKLIFEVYKFANLHILRCLRDNEELPKIEQQFFYKCCCYVSELYERKAPDTTTVSFDKTFEIYKPLRPKNYKPAYRNYIIQILGYICKQMVIDTLNHLELNFYNRLYNYIKNFYSNKISYEISRDICAGTYNGTDEIVLKYRNILGNNPPYRKYIENEPLRILTIYNEILTYNIINNKKLFSLFPNKNKFTMNYITLDKSVLKDLLADIGLEGFSRTHFDSNVRQYWEKLFNIKKFETKNKTFHSFTTDGVSVSIILERKKFTKPTAIKSTTKSKKPKITVKEKIDYGDKVLIGLDPGMRMLFVASNDQNNNTIECSGKRYYHEVGINKFNNKQQRRYKRDKEILSYFENISTFTCKTNNIEKLCEHIKHTLSLLDKVLYFHFKHPFRKWKLTKYILEKKKMNEMCKAITGKTKINEESKVIVGFGNWSNPGTSIIRGHKRGPVLEFKKELKKWCQVVDVDEFRTSRLCSNCHCDTEKVSYNGVKVNSVLRCTNNECRMIIDRDINGCKNILTIFKSDLGLINKPDPFKRTNISLLRKH